MAHQDEGWPLGLRPLNARVGLIRNRNLSAGSVSFSTLITGSSPTSSIDSSSDLDTESTGSFFHDKSITLGSLIGVSGIFDISRRSTRGRRVEISKHKKNHKPTPWLFSLCSKPTSDSVDMSTNTPSLGHFLEAERRVRTNNINSKNHGGAYEDGHDTYSPADQPSDLQNADGGTRSNTRSNRELLEYGNHGFGTPLLLSCLCGQLIK